MTRTNDVLREFTGVKEVIWPRVLAASILELPYKVFANGLFKTQCGSLISLSYASVTLSNGEEFECEIAVEENFSKLLDNENSLFLTSHPSNEGPFYLEIYYE